MTANRRVLVVEDDEDLGEMLTEQLQIHEEFVTELVSKGTNAIELTKDQYFDIIILDVGLPDMDGREVCRVMRRNGVKSPIIMLTGADTDADTILGLDAGANDYVTKPFRIGVLMARLRSHIREHGIFALFVFANMGAQAGHENADAEWFGHVIVGSRIKPEDCVSIGVGSRQHNNRRFNTVASHDTADFAAIHVRQCYIQNDDVKILVFGQVNCARAVVRQLSYIFIMNLKLLNEHFAQFFIVLNDEHPSVCGHSPLSR